MKDELEILKAQLATLTADVREMQTAMRGDMQGHPGVLKNLIDLMNTVYDKKEGLLPRVRKLEEWKVKQLAWVAGAVTAGMVTWRLLELGVTALIHLKP